ncbi:MAG: hypothetical protein AVO38_03030 [delta proteobacterium ML8_D]|nr:MAG: hypothetical protein AVO38_03030 [delta proteobacterium ML8_D]
MNNSFLSLFNFTKKIKFSMDKKRTNFYFIDGVFGAYFAKSIGLIKDFVNKVTTKKPPFLR